MRSHEVRPVSCHHVLPRLAAASERKPRSGLRQHYYRAVQSPWRCSNIMAVLGRSCTCSRRASKRISLTGTIECLTGTSIVAWQVQGVCVPDRYGFCTLYLTGTISVPVRLPVYPTGTKISSCFCTCQEKKLPGRYTLKLPVRYIMLYLTG